MTKEKVEKILIISFIGFIITLLVGLGGNFILKAGLPTSSSNSDINFSGRQLALEDELSSGKISRAQFDSLSDLLRVQLKNKEAISNNHSDPDILPSWVTDLGISEPEGLKHDAVFSDYTSVDDPAEGFNSIIMVYTGKYETAMNEAHKIAESAGLKIGGVFNAKGGPVNHIKDLKNGISYLNYSLGNADPEFLISVQVEPSGRLTLMVTNNKQLNSRLMVYEPLNNRINSKPNQKKQ